MNKCVKNLGGPYAEGRSVSVIPSTICAVTRDPSRPTAAMDGWLLDTRGMRELQLADTTSGLAEVFDDIVAITH